MKLVIITPEAKIFDGEIKSVTLPGTLGLFEVLENHAPIISSLKSGAMKYQTADGSEHRLSISGGFAEVNNNSVNVCVESAQHQKDNAD